MINKIFMIVPDIGIFEYSNTNVILSYDPGFKDDTQFQFLKIKEAGKGFDAIKIVLALDYEFPKDSYLVLGKQICDELKNLRDRFSSSEAKNLISSDFIKKRIENLIIQNGSLSHLRFSKNFKLTSVEWDNNTPIGVFGLDKAGKTTILSYLSTGEFIHEYTPTLGMNRYTLPGILGASWEPVFLEISGRTDFRPLWHDYSDLAGIMYVIDTSDERRLSEAIDELKKLLINPNFINKPFAIFANKQDIPESLEMSRIISEISKISSSYRISVFSTSGITGEGIPAALHFLLEYIWFLEQNPDIKKNK
ncbi:MAG: ADP-ribosylation factor-like protein [Candidatus Thorarchaeota archaeon]